MGELWGAKSNYPLLRILEMSGMYLTYSYVLILGQTNARRNNQNTVLEQAEHGSMMKHAVVDMLMSQLNSNHAKHQCLGIVTHRLAG